VAGGLAERGGGDTQDHRRGLERLASVESRRYDYWRVGLDAYAEHPLRGIGAGGFRVEWLRERPVSEGALELHSLPLELLVELGLPGLLGLLLTAGGVAMASRRALERRPELAPGACAAATVWFVHASIDWDWQLPAVTLPALIAAGALIAASEDGSGAPRPRATTARSAGSAA
jgi:O-antigen ligase